MYTKEIKHERLGFNYIKNKNFNLALKEFEDLAKINPGSVAVLRGLLSIFKFDQSNENFIKLQDAIGKFLIFHKKRGKSPSDFESLVTILNSAMMSSLVVNGKHPILSKEIKNQRKIGRKKFVILTCLWKREKVTDLFLSYYSKFRKVLSATHDLDLLAIGSEGDLTKSMVESYGFNYLEYPNKPVSKKWQFGISNLKNFDFDAAIIVGSDDLIDSKVIRNYIEALDNGCLFFGFEDAFIYDPIDQDLLYWPGYGHITSAMPNRILETVGLGRMLSKELLELLDYTIWGNIEANSSLDSIMHKRLTQDLKILPVKSLKNSVQIKGFNVGLFCGNMRLSKAMGIGLKAGEVNITPADKFKSVPGIEHVQGDEKNHFKKILSTCNKEKVKRISNIDVTIIIMAHKESDYLDKCIQSALNQKFSGKYEVILAADSNKSLIKYAEKYKIKFSLSNKKIKNNSCSKNLNDAVSESEGDFIKILAYDDFLPENSIQDLYDHAKNTGASLVFANAYEYYNDKKIINYSPPEKHVSIESQAEKNIIHGGTILFKRLDYLYVGGFNENLQYAEEYDFYFKLLINGFKLSYTDKFTYYYRRHSEQKGTLSLTNEEKQAKTIIVKGIGDKYVSAVNKFTTQVFLDGPVVFGVATIECRIPSLIETIKSIYNQADHILIYQNGYKKIGLVDDPLSKIKYYSSLDTGVDKGDAGKFYFVDEYKNCFYFSIDDDLIYPENYAEVLINKLKSSNRPAIVSCHGKIFKPNATNWFKDILINFRCLDCESEEFLLQFGGTGVMAFHTSYFLPPFDLFQKENMADSWIGLFAKSVGINIISVKHAEGWIKSTESFDNLENKSTIYSSRSKENFECFENKILSEYFKITYGAGSFQLIN